MLGSEGDHSFLSIPEVKNEWGSTSIPTHVLIELFLLMNDLDLYLNGQSL
jgi:hypothetical protein